MNKIANNIGMKAHHVGCLTENIEASIAVYKQMGFSHFSPVFTIVAQNVKVCFVQVGAGFFVELVEFTTLQKSLEKMFKSGNPYYHIGYRVEDIDVQINALLNEGFHLVNRFTSEAFEGRACAFLYSPEMHLVELIESDAI